MPRSATTGVYTRVSNSFSQPVFGTLIDPTDADAYFDDLDVGLNPPQLAAPLRIINALQVGTTGTAAGTVEFFNATSGSITISPPTGALGSVTMTLPDATDTFVGKNTTDVLNNKTMNSPVINGGLVSALTGFSLRDTSAAFNVTFTATASPILTGSRVLTINMQNADQTLMTLSAAETVTGVKTFGAAGNVGKLVVAGTTSGNTILNATAVASGTLTLPAATDTLVGKATTDTLTNKTFNSAGTGNTLQVSSVTVSAGQYPGETTTGSATAGNVGEILTATQGSAQSLTNNTALTITSVSLTAGDWDVSGTISFAYAATTVAQTLVASISTTTNTLDGTLGRLNSFNFGTAGVVPNGGFTMNTPVTRVSLSSTTTVFLVAQSGFTTSTATATAFIRARRAR